MFNFRISLTKLVGLKVSPFPNFLTGTSCFASYSPKALFQINRWIGHGWIHEGNTMNCTRCHGTMVLDYFLDIEDSEEVWMPGWRCLACGEVIDPIILKHRQAQEAQSELVGAISNGSANKTLAPIAIFPQNPKPRQHKRVLSKK